MRTYLKNVKSKLIRDFMFYRVPILGLFYFLKRGDKLIVTDIKGQTEMLTDYKIEERVQRVNGEHLLSFFVPKTENNKHAFDLVQEESIVEYDGQEYRTKSLEERTTNG